MELLKSKKHLISWLWLLSGLIAAPNYAAAEEWIYTIRPEIICGMSPSGI